MPSSGDDRGGLSRRALLGAAGLLAVVGFAVWVVVQPAASELPWGASAESREFGDLPFQFPVPPPVPAETTPLVPDELEAPSDADARHTPTPATLQVGRTVQLTVIDAKGQLVPDALVEAWNGVEDSRLAEPPAEPAELSLHTDLDGTCSVPVIGGATAIVASKAEQGTTGAWICPAEPPEVVRLELRQRAVVAGQVVNLNGRPVPQAEVVLIPEFGLPTEQQPRSPATLSTDQDGRFTVEVDAPFHARTQCRLGDMSALETLVYVDPGDRVDISIRFGGAYAISGSVISDVGDPVEGAKLTLELESVSPDFHLPATQSTSTAPDGRFTFELGTPGTYALAIESDVWMQAQPLEATVTREVPVVEVQVQCVQPARITGKVVWDDGQPVDDAFIHAGIDEPDLPRLSLHQTLALETNRWSRPDGSFRVEPVHPGYRYELDVSQSDAHTLVRGVRPGTTDLVIELNRQSPSRASLMGRVTDLDTGAPVLRFETAIDSWSESGIFVVTKKWISQDTADGRFHLDGVQLGKSYGLEIRAEGFEPRTFRVVPTEQEQAFELGHRQDVVLELVNESGDPAPGVTVALLDDMSPTGLAPPRNQGATDADGRVSWTQLPPGDYWLMASGGAGAAGPMRLSVGRAARGVRRVQLTSALLDGRVEVTVLDRDGRPVSGAQVAAWPNHVMTTGERKPDSRRTQSDALGRCDLTLAPGAYLLLVQQGNAAFPLVRVLIGSEESIQLEVQAK